MTAHPDRHIIRDDQGWHTNRELLEEAKTIRANLAGYSLKTLIERPGRGETSPAFSLFGRGSREPTSPSSPLRFP